MFTLSDREITLSRDLSYVCLSSKIIRVYSKVTGCKFLDKIFDPNDVWLGR